MLTENNIKINPIIGLLISATIITYYSGYYYGISDFGFEILFPILFIFSLIQDRKTFNKNNDEIIMFLLFLLLCLVGVFYRNIDFTLLESSFLQIMAAFMGAYIAMAYNKVKDFEDYFHIGFIIAIILLVLSEYLFGNFILNSFYKPQGSRTVFLYNANYYSYMSLFANFSIFRLHLKYKNKLTLIGLILVPILALAMAFTTQSRSGLLFIIMINAVFWFWVNKDKLQHPLKKLARYFFLIVISVVFALQFLDYYNQSSIQKRISNSGGGGREYLFEQGLNVFMEYPLTGVGLGNFVNYNRYGLFTHSSYSEALAEHGLFIGGIIIMVFVLPFYKSLRLFLKFRNNEFVKLNFLFFATFLIFNNVYVFYKASYSMMYFFLMISVYYKLESNTNKL